MGVGVQEGQEKKMYAGGLIKKIEKKNFDTFFFEIFLPGGNFPKTIKYIE